MSPVVRRGPERARRWVAMTRMFDHVALTPAVFREDPHEWADAAHRGGPERHAAGRSHRPLSRHRAPSHRRRRGCGAGGMGAAAPGGRSLPAGLSADGARHW